MAYSSDKCAHVGWLIEKESHLRLKPWYQTEIKTVKFSTTSRHEFTEKDIRAAVGDNVGTGKALRLLCSEGYWLR